MRTPPRSDRCRPSQWLLVAAAAIALGACGVDTSPHYHDKGPDGTANDADQTVNEVPPDAANGDAAIESVKIDERQAEEAKKKAETPPTTVDPDADAEVSIDPSMLVSNNHFRSTFDLASVKRLRNGFVPTANLSVAAKTVNAKLEGSTADDGVTIQQTYGDGKVRSRGTQTITNSVGDKDANPKTGVATQTGVQTYFRVTGAVGCPNVFVCIEKMTFEPKVGDPSTYCYYDKTGKEAVAIPYAVASNYAAKDFTAEVYKQYGPFSAKRFAGKDVDCVKPPAKSDAQELVLITVTAGTSDLAKIPRLFQDPALPITHEVIIETHRAANDNRAPYLDETLRLNAKTRFMLNETKQTLVMMIKSVRKTVKLAFPQNLAVNMDGVLVDARFELCQNKLAKDGGSYCK